MTVNSVGQAGVQYTQGDEAGSPAGKEPTHTLAPFPSFVVEWDPRERFFFFVFSDIQIKEEPDSEEWQLSGDSTLNPNDLSNLRVQMGDEDMDMPSGEGKRLRRVACTCPNCKEAGGRWVSPKTRSRMLNISLNLGMKRGSCMGGPVPS